MDPGSDARLRRGTDGMKQSRKRGAKRPRGRRQSRGGLCRPQIRFSPPLRNFTSHESSCSPDGWVGSVRPFGWNQRVEARLWHPKTSLTPVISLTGRVATRPDQNATYLIILLSFTKTSVITRQVSLLIAREAGGPRAHTCPPRISFQSRRLLSPHTPRFLGNGLRDRACSTPAGISP